MPYPHAPFATSNPHAPGEGQTGAGGFLLPPPTGSAAIDGLALETALKSEVSLVIAQEGTYLHKGLKIPSNKHLRGGGRGVTTLKLAKESNVDSIVNANEAAGNERITISDLTVDGNKAEQAGTNNHHGIHLVRCPECEVRSVETKNADGHGLSLDGNGTVTRGAKVLNLWTHGNSQMGARNTFAMRQSHWTDIHAYENGLHGYQDDSSESTGTNIDCRKNTGHGIFIRNVFGCVYTNLRATQNGEHGIQVLGFVNSTGVNWYAANNSTSVENTFNDVNFSGTANLSLGLTSKSTVWGLRAEPNGEYGVTTEKNCLNIEDAEAGEWGDLKIFGAVVGTGKTGQFRIPAVPGGIVLWDFPGGTSNLRLWTGAGIAAPNGMKIGTAASNKLGFFGVAPVEQRATIAVPAETLAANTKAIKELIEAAKSLGLIA